MCGNLRLFGGYHSSASRSFQFHKYVSDILDDATRSMQISANNHINTGFKPSVRYKCQTYVQTT